MGVFLSCQNLGKSYGPRPLFEGLSFGLNERERTGLIGPNGAGKSTLLKILVGLDTPDEGSVSMRRGLRLGYLAQQDRFDDVSEHITVRDELVEALQGLNLEEYEIDMRIEAGLADAGFKDPGMQVNSLSGGWRKRLAILAQVVREPDLLLLDEPTNHLDLEGVLWLEQFLSGLQFAFITVTHDRRFRVIEINKRYPNGHYSSAGAYSDFLENREAFFASEESREEALRNTVRGEIAWLRRGAKAQMKKGKARVDKAGELIGELAELEYRNAQNKAATIDFSGSERQSKSLVRLIKAEKSMGGKKLFGPLDLMLGPGDRLGLLGANGSGKSTLLKMLAGELAPDAGTVRQADRLQVVTFDQHREQLDMDQTLQRALCGDGGEHIEYKGARIHVRGWAARFLFQQHQMDFTLKQLSGGEQSRVLIARLMLKPADLLLLDEPTNDLDLQSLEVLESSMLEFPGALVLVTHDRYLLDRVSQQLLALDGRGNANFYADLSQWETAQARRASEPEPAPAPKAAPAPAPVKAAPSGKEVKKLEKEIEAAEAALASAQTALEDPSISTDAGELSKRHSAVDAARKRVDELMARWESLNS